MVGIPTIRGGCIHAKRIAVDEYGRWVFQYDRGKTRCARPIFREDGSIVRHPSRPLGADLLDTVNSIIGRAMTPREEHKVMGLPIIA